MTGIFDIIMIGPQGSGKGTQAQILSQRLGIPTLSMGQMLRMQIEAGTELGKRIDDHITRGGLVSAETTTEVIYDRLQQVDVANGVILDGYPRTLPQLESFDKILRDLGREVTQVIFLDIAEAVSLERLSGRRVCSNVKCETNYHVLWNKPKIENICDKCGAKLIQRNDDTPEAITKRLRLYHAETAPLVLEYSRRGVLATINGDQSIEQVAVDIAKALKLE